MSEKNKLAEKLLYAPKNGYDRLSAEDEKAMEAYCEDYKKFLNNGKTERLCVEYCIELAEKKGFKAYEGGMALKAGDKVYFNNRGKGIMLAVIGSEGQGVRQSLLEAAAQSVIIPMRQNTESLNAAAAAAILMWEKQKGGSGFS